MLNERFFDSVIWLDSMVDTTNIIGQTAGDLYQLGDVARQNAGTYGKDTHAEIGFGFQTPPEKFGNSLAGQEFFGRCSRSEQILRSGRNVKKTCGIPDHHAQPDILESKTPDG